MHERTADLDEKDLKESGFVRGYALIYIRRQKCWKDLKRCTVTSHVCM